MSGTSEAITIAVCASATATVVAAAISVASSAVADTDTLLSTPATIMSVVDARQVHAGAAIAGGRPLCPQPTAGQWSMRTIDEEHACTHDEGAAG